MFELFEGGLVIARHYDLRVAIPFLTTLNCYLSVMSRYVKNMTYTLDLLGGGSTTTNIPSLHVALIMLIMNWHKNMVFEQQQSTYGRRMWMHYGQFGMNIVNSLSIVMMGLKVCVSQFVFVASVE